MGEYVGQVPSLLISDQKLAKQILVKDFHIFNQSQKMPVIPKLFEHSMTNLSGPEWKVIRSAVSPTFTTGKLRRTVKHLSLPIQNFFENLDNLIRLGEEDKIGIKDLSKGYALDVIAKFVFAVEVNSFKQKQDPFVKNVFRMTQFRQWPFFIMQLFPVFVSKHFANKIFDEKAWEYFAELTKQILQKRRAETELQYNDFLELMLENSNKIADAKIITQCILFFFAGMDTVSTATSIVLSDIAIHQDVQEKLFSEIQNKLGDEKLDYDNINELPYLDAVFCESLRMTPVVTRLIRHPQSDYKLKDTGLTLEKDKPVMISVHNIHHDEEVFENPFMYRPERFMEESSKKLQNHWFPFGDGPRKDLSIII